MNTQQGSPPAIITWTRSFCISVPSHWNVEFPNAKYSWTATNLSDLARIVDGLPIPGETR